MNENSPQESPRETTQESGSAVSGFLIVLGLVIGYFALQLWILPSMGVAT